MKPSRTTKLSFFLLAAAAVPLLSPAPAHAVVKLSVLGGVNLADPSLNDYQSSPNTLVSRDDSMRVGPMGGVTAEYSFGDNFGIELGAFYIYRRYNVDSRIISSGAQTSRSDLDTAYKTFHFPLMARFTLFHWINLGAGGYYSRIVGRGHVDGSVTGPGGSATVDADVGVPDELKNDWGLVGAVGLQIPILPFMKLRPEARYVYGLDDNEIEGTMATERTRDIQALLGLQFQI